MMVSSNKTTQNEFLSDVKGLETDLLKVFKSIEDDTQSILAQAEKENWEPEHIINAIDALFEKVED